MEIIISIIPFLLMLYAYYIYSINIKKDDLEFEIKIGFLCYNCRKQTTNGNFNSYIKVDRQEELKLCKKCNRSFNKINKVIRREKIKKIILIFNKIIFNTKLYKNLSLMVIISYISLISLFIFLRHVMNIKTMLLFYIYNLLITIYWIILIYKFKICRKKI